jgi:hypothetical protein
MSLNKKVTKNYTLIRTFLVIACAVSVTSCSRKHTRSNISVDPSNTLIDSSTGLRPTEDYLQQEGTMEFVWEEPMVDVIDVPPGYDPEGHYYRPAHRALREVQQGQYRYLRGDETQ